MSRARQLMAGLVALAALAAPVAAGVSGLYYQEELKDGRYYVFNTPEAYKAWKGSGEMGKSITLVGRGPAGETVVAENETAADLFLFKHNLPGYDRETPPPEKLPFDISWKDGKTTIASKNSELIISNRVQVRLTQTDPDGGDSVGSFRIRRFKTKFEGWVYTKNLKYELQLNWPDTSDPLEDANLDYDFSKGEKAFQLKFGQFKVPFGRQELTSSGSQQFVDRSIVSGEFARGRDIGLQFHGQGGDGKVDWRIGVFNGNGRTRSSNDNDEYQYNARVTFQPFGDAKYSEGDFDSSDKPLFAIAANYESNDAHGSTTDDDNDREILGADVVFKYKGFFAFAELFQADNTLESGLAFDSEGLHGQLGYFIIPKKFEIAFRYAQLDPADLVDNDDRTETGIAFGYFWNKHSHKLQADVREIEDDSDGTTDTEVRVQYQVIF